jgi:hypothetical protein
MVSIPSTRHKTPARMSGGRAYDKPNYRELKHWVRWRQMGHQQDHKSRPSVNTTNLPYFLPPSPLASMSSLAFLK